jgi:hypothetical protein
MHLGACVFLLPLDHFLTATQDDSMEETSPFPRALSG